MPSPNVPDKGNVLQDNGDPRDSRETENPITYWSLLVSLIPIKLHPYYVGCFTSKLHAYYVGCFFFFSGNLKDVNFFIKVPYMFRTMNPLPVSAK